MIRTPKIEVYLATDGSWRWRLRASNGEVVASGEGYGSRKDAVRGSRALRVAALTARTVDGG